MIVPMSAQNNIVLSVSTLTPRFGPSCTRIHDPKRNPRAIPTPWGEIASPPNRCTRSSTGQPRAPRSGDTQRSLAAAVGEHLADRFAEEESSHDVRGVVHTYVRPRDPDGSGEPGE